MIAGVLELQMTANLARITDDMRQVKSIVGSATSAVSEMARTAKEALGAIGIGIGLDSFKELISSAIEATDHLGDLSQVTGMSVESLSQYQQVAKLAGTSIDAVATGMEHLARSMAESNNATSPAATALKFLGLSAKDANGNLKDLGQMQMEIAVALSRYADGAGKVAVMQDLEGKGAASLINFMHELAESRNVNVDVTKEQTEQAHALVLEFRQLSIDSDTLKRGFALGLTPSILDIVKAFVELKGKQDDVTGFGEAVGTVFRGVALVAGSIWIGMKDMGDGIGALAAQAVAAAHLDFAAVAAIGAARDAQSAKNQQDLTDFQASVMKTHEAIKASSDDAGKPTANYSHPDTQAASALLAQDRLYRSALQELTEEAGKQNAMTKEEIITNRLLGGTWETIYEKHGAQLIQIARGLDIHNNQIAVLKNETEAMAGLSKAMEAQAAIRISAGDSDATAINDMQFQITLIGKTTEEQQRLTATRQVDLKLQQDLLQAAKEADKYDPLLGGEVFTQSVSDLTAAAQKQKQTIAGMIDDRTALERSWGVGAKSAFDDYIDHATNAAERTKSAFSSAFTTLEDIELDFATNSGKNWQQLALSFITQIARMELAAENAKFLKAIQDDGGFMNFLGKILGGSGSGTSTVGTATPDAVGSFVLGNYATGTDSVPHTGPYLLHQGEKVTQASEASDSGGHTFYVDARGADTAAVSRLEQMVHAINGQLEYRAVNAVADMAQRSPAYARQVSGR